MRDFPNWWGKVGIGRDSFRIELEATRNLSTLDTIPQSSTKRLHTILYLLVEEVLCQRSEGALERGAPRVRECQRSVNKSCCGLGQMCALEETE
jgi:hypothetical protein